VSAGSGALAVADALSAFAQQQQAGALTMEGIGANQTILDPRLQAARPAAGQQQAAKGLRDLLARDKAPTPATLQDPLSIRCMPSIHGALLQAIDQARQAVEIELNAAADNPLVLGDDDMVLSTGNFHTPSLSLAFETLGLAIAQCAAACAARFIQLTGSGRNGLPRYLSPVGGASAGFVPLQKTVTAILAAIRHKANPVMLGRRRGPCDASSAGRFEMRRHDRAVAAADRLRADGRRTGRRPARRADAGAGDRRDSCGGARACPADQGGQAPGH
jgi:histidine ammonia-lyase